MKLNTTPKILLALVMASLFLLSLKSIITLKEITKLRKNHVILNVGLILIKWTAIRQMKFALQLSLEYLKTNCLIAKIPI